MWVWRLVVTGLILVGCGGGGGGGTDAHDHVDAPVDASACAIAGRYVMTTVFCGTNDVTASIRNQGGIDTMVLEVSAGSTCHLRATFTGPTCVEVDERDVNVDGTGAFTQTSAQGITSCQPAACKFNAGDQACALGDRMVDDGLTSAETHANVIVVTNHPPAGLCQSFSLDTITTYTRM